MATKVRNKETGEVFYMLDNGSMVPVEAIEGRENLPIYNEDVSDWQRVKDFGAVAGAALRDYGAGIENLMGADRDELAGEYYARQRELDPVRARSPMVSAIADIAPELAMSFADKGRSLAWSLGLGGAEGLRFRPDVEDQLIAGGVGAGAGFGGTVIGRVLDGALGLYDSMMPEVIRRADELDVPYSAGEVSGRSLKQVEQVGEDLTGSGIFKAHPAERRQILMNQRANASIGQQGAQVTKENLKAARAEINAMYGPIVEALGDTQLPETLVKNIRAVFTKLNKLEELSAFKGLGKNGDGTVTADELISLHRRMVNQADRAEGGATGDAMDSLLIQSEILRPLDSIIKGKLPNEQYSNWLTARERGRMLNILTDRQVVKGGDVSAANLANRLYKNLDEVMFEGDLSRLYLPASRDMVETADIIADPALRGLPNSGTATRLANMAIPFAIGADAVTGGMATTGAVAGGTLANAATQGVLRSAPRTLGTAAIAAQEGAQAGLNQIGNVGSLLDDILFPFYGDEYEGQQ